MNNVPDFSYTVSNRLYIRQYQHRALQRFPPLGAHASSHFTCTLWRSVCLVACGSTLTRPSVILCEHVSLSHAAHSGVE